MPQHGSIKWFSPSKGYGFITREGGEDLFVHFSGLRSGQDRRLYPGDKVTFEEEVGERGPKATDVSCYEQAPRPEASGSDAPAAVGLDEGADADTNAGTDADAGTARSA